MTPQELINNVVTAVIGIAALLVSAALVVLCYRYTFKRLPKPIQSLVLLIKKKLMWNSVLRYSTQKYLSTAIQCFLSFGVFATLTTFARVSVPLTLVYLLAWPVLILYMLWRKRAILGTKETKDTVGSLYLNFETDKPSAWQFTPLFMYRRLLFAFVIAAMSYSIVMQVLVLIYSSLAFMSYLLVYEPMEAYHYDLTAIANEYVLLFSFYFMFLFTDFVPEPEVRFMFGQKYLTLLYIDLALNLLALVYEVLR